MIEETKTLKELTKELSEMFVGYSGFVPDISSIKINEKNKIRVDFVPKPYEVEMFPLTIKPAGLDELITYYLAVAAKITEIRDNYLKSLEVKTEEKPE